METEKNAGPNYLKAWREFRRMTQDDVAEKLGTTGAVISLLEEGKRGLSAKWLRRLAPVLHTTPGLLLDHDPHELPTDVLEIWASIPDDQRDQARRILDTFARQSTA